MLAKISLDWKSTIFIVIVLDNSKQLIFFIGTAHEINYPWIKSASFDFVLNSSDTSPVPVCVQSLKFCLKSLFEKFEYCKHTTVRLHQPFKGRLWWKLLESPENIYLLTCFDHLLGSIYTSSCVSLYYKVKLKWSEIL